MMLHELLKSVVWVQPQAVTGSYLSLTSVAELAEFHPVAPIRVLKWGFIASNTTVVSASGSQLLLSTLPSPGGALTQVDTLSPGAQTIAAGAGCYRETFTPSTVSAAVPSELPASGPLGVQGNNNVTSGQQQLTLPAGQALAISVGTGFTSGTAVLFIEYVLLPIAKPSGYGFGATSPDGVVAGSVSLTDTLQQLAS